MIGAGLVISDNDCYELTEDIVYSGIATYAITFAPGTVATLDGKGHEIVLTQAVSGAVNIGNLCDVQVRALNVRKPSVALGVAINVNRNATALIEKVQCTGTGTCVQIRGRSNVIVRDIEVSAQFDSAEMYDFWGFGYGYAVNGISSVDGSNLMVDGWSVRCLDARIELGRDPSPFQDWLCRGIYVGKSSSEPVVDFQAPGNYSHTVIRNGVYSGSAPAMILPYLNSLVLENLALTVGDAFAETGLQIGCDTVSYSVVMRDVSIDARNVRPETYSFGGGIEAYAFIPLAIQGMSSVDIDGLNIVGRSAVYLDAQNGVGFGPILWRLPLVLIDAPWFCVTSFCEGEPSQSIVIRNSVLVASDAATTPLLIGTGHGLGGKVSAVLDNVNIVNGTIGVMIGANSAAVRMRNVDIQGSYWGMIVTNNTRGVIAQGLRVQQTCVPLWLQANSQYNLIQDSEFTMNGQAHINDNPADNDVVSTNDRFVLNNCGPAPELFEAPNFAPYRDFVAPASADYAKLVEMLSARDPELDFDRLMAARAPSNATAAAA